jgi:hypothetical protein
MAHRLDDVRLAVMMLDGSSGGGSGGRRLTRPHPVGAVERIASRHSFQPRAVDEALELGLVDAQARTASAQLHWGQPAGLDESVHLARAQVGSFANCFESVADASASHLFPSESGYRLSRRGVFFSMVRGDMPVHLPKAAQAAYRGLNSARLAIWSLTHGEVDLLRRGLALQKLSKASFDGFATTHPTRQWEYPWVVKEVERRMAGRKRTAADIGAGRSPVPIALTRLGLRCIVADPGVSPTLGEPARGEWLLTDYRQWGIDTQAVGMQDFVVESDSLGFIVCISVIEHVDAATRRKGWENFGNALEPGGVAVLTIDLLGQTDQLWNRVLGAEIEPFDVHGRVEDLILEAANVGLMLEHKERSPLSPRWLRHGPGRMTDTMALVFVKGT